ncbi:MAG: hypothetical protein ACKOE6_13295, partial [Flammeovirgaceae bacterium]
AYQEVWKEIARNEFGLTLSEEDLAPDGYYLDLAKEVTDIKKQYSINFYIWSDEEIKYFNLRESK